MKTNIKPTPKAKTYSNDAIKWPNGIYTINLETCNPHVQVVDGGVWIVGPASMVPLETKTGRTFLSDFYRIPGYTGRIAAIEFEREEEFK